MLLGAFTWDGETRSFGLIVNQAPKPASFTFDFKSSMRAGSTKMGFSRRRRHQHHAPAAARAEARHHSRARASSQGRDRSAERHHGAVARLDANPCDRRLPIFDGKERFDLVLSYKGEMKVTEQPPSGQPGVAHVCRVRYLPIAGHKVDAETSFMAANDEIEVALRPVPSANVLVPYQINIPTMAGAATIVSKRVEIASPGKPQIALLH